MLVLTRKSGGEIQIGEDVRVVVRRISGNRVVLAIEAPQGIRILRGELVPFADQFDEVPSAKLDRFGGRMKPAAYGICAAGPTGSEVGVPPARQGV